MQSFKQFIWGTPKPKVEYLMTRLGAIRIEPSTRYAKMYKVRGEDFYIEVRALKPCKPTLLTPDDADEVFVIRDGPTDFDTFYVRWLGGNASLYRGFPGCHFSLPKLISTGVLYSEGTADLPTFTMGNTQKTRWLPTALQDSLASGVALQCVDLFTRKFSAKAKVLMGVTVKITVGSGRNLPTAWLNSGEIVVRGPLNPNQFALHTVVWLGPTSVTFTRWPDNFPPSRLPPIRPYMPKLEKQITDWYVDYVAWCGEMARRGFPGMVLRLRGG